MSRGDFKDTSKASIAGKKSKRGKTPLNKLKDQIGIDRTEQIIEKIEQNIDEFINHKDIKIRLDATKAFTDYYKPRKREHTGRISGTINLVMNPKLVEEPNSDTSEQP